MFDFALTAEQTQMRAAARAFVKQQIIPVAEEYDRSSEPPLHIYGKFFEEGWQSTFLPDDPGQQRNYLVNMSIVAEELAYGCAGIAGAILTTIFANRLILQHGSGEARARLREELRAKRFTASFTATEREAGSDLRAIQTKAQCVDGRYVINGAKAFCSNIRHASRVVVMARMANDEQKWASAFSWFMVPTDTPGAIVGKRWETLGLRSVDVSPIEFQNVQVPISYRLGEEGKALSLIAESFNQSRTLIAAMAVGIARRARDEIMRYGRERRLYGDRLYKLQDYRFQMVEMEKDIAAARALVWMSGMKNDRGLDNSKENGIAKLFAGQMVMRVTGAASLMMGGLGYTRAAVVEKLLRDARYIAIVEGPEPVQKELVFAQMLRRDLY